MKIRENLRSYATFLRDGTYFLWSLEVELKPEGSKRIYFNSK